MANLDITHAKCPVCKKTTRHERTGVNHILHLLVSVFMLGLWIPVWILLTMCQGPYLCSDCGHKVRKTSPLTYIIIAPFALIFILTFIGYISQLINV